MKKSKLIVSLSAALLLATVPFTTTDVTADAKVVDKTVPVQFLGMNDLHGYIDGNNKKDANGAVIGGMASLAYHFEQEKAAFAKANKLKSTKN